MRVYFIGAHSTGKSTMAEYVATKYELPLIKEIAREVLNEYKYMDIDIAQLRSDIRMVNSFQKNVVSKQITEEKKLGPNFVSDRSFDGLAYMAQHSTELFNVLNNKDFDYNEYIKTLKMPDVVTFFIRPSKATLKNDGVRESVTWDGVIAIDAMVKFMLEMWAIPYVQINTDSIQERIRLIDSVLSPIMINQTKQHDS